MNKSDVLDAIEDSEVGSFYLDFLDTTVERSSLSVKDVTQIDITKMPSENVAQVYKQLLKKWGFSESEKVMVATEVISFLIVNGTSRFSGDAYITINKTKYPISDLISIAGSTPGQTIRRFASRQADFAHLILMENPSLAEEANKKWGLPNDYSTYAFDFALSCSKIGVGSALYYALKDCKFQHISESDHSNKDFNNSSSGNSFSDLLPKTNTRKTSTSANRI